MALGIYTGPDITYCMTHPRDPTCGQSMGGSWASKVGADYVISQQYTAPGQTVTVAGATPWYKTWWGIAGLVGLGLAAYKLTR